MTTFPSLSILLSLGIKTEISPIKTRAKKIKVINDLEDRIVEIEKELQYEKGYLEGKEK